MSWEDRSYNRDNTGGMQPVRLPSITPMALTLICVNLGIFLIKVAPDVYFRLVEAGGLRFGPGTPAWQVWRWVTYQYLHGNGWHVFFNVLALYFFVPTLERRWGWRKTLGFYTLGGVAAGVLFLLVSLLSGGWPTLIGASGSVFACLGAVAFLYPEQQLILLIFPVPIRVAAGLFALLFLLTAVGDRSYADAAHLGGLAFGFTAPWLGGPFVAKQQQQFSRRMAVRRRQEEIDEQAAVDLVLDKVARTGMNSLSARERKTLQRASVNQRKRDLRRARNY